MWVSLPALIQPDYYNFNPTPGQTVENQHVSQYDDIYRGLAGSLLKARLISAAETHFILAEAALKGWAVGSAETNYENGVKSSLDAWGVGGDFASYIAEPGVAFNGTLDAGDRTKVDCQLDFRNGSLDGFQKNWSPRTASRPCITRACFAS